MTLVFELGTEDDAPALAALHSAVAGRLTRDFGAGHWSPNASEASVVRGIRTSRVIIARDESGIAGTLRLATRKPLAIDPKYFQAVARPIYLLDMAVRPSAQRTGTGRRLIEQAVLIARDAQAGAIRLDAYDAPAGAGGFYAKCGFREVGRAEHRKVRLIYYEMLLEP
ncbi:MAG: GNAT family N-acetyltransferase [Vicinamibacterales bacterium]